MPARAQQIGAVCCKKSLNLGLNLLSIIPFISLMKGLTLTGCCPNPRGRARGYYEKISRRDDEAYLNGMSRRSNAERAHKSLSPSGLRRFWAYPALRSLGIPQRVFL